jgi:hypothetical protein
MRKSSGGTSANERRALRTLRDAGMMERYSAKDKVVLDCGHIVVIDAPIRRSGRYSSYCDEHHDWRLIVRRATPRDSVGGISEEGPNPLW